MPLLILCPYHEAAVIILTGGGDWSHYNCIYNTTSNLQDYNCIELVPPLLCASTLTPIPLSMCNR